MNMPTFAYVANDNKVSVVDTSTNTVVNTIPVLSADNITKVIAITPDGNFAYVTNVGDDNVSVIDTNTNAVVQSVPVGACPFGIAITPDGDFVYVTNACDNNVSVIATDTNTVVDTILVGDFPLGIAIANIDFPCPTPLDKMCIETTKIFDSCMFELEKTLEVQNLNKAQDIQCDIIETKCSILDMAKIDEQQDLVDLKLQIKIFIRFTSKCFNDNALKRVVCFDKNITLVSPEGADVCCDVNKVTCACVCNQSSQVGMISCNNKLCCTVKVTAVVKSKKLVQIEIPFLRYCEPKQCCPNERITIAPGKSYPLPIEPSEINRIMFVAKTDPGITSRVIVLLYGLPSNFATVTEKLKPFKLNLPGSPYPVENILLKNLGNSNIYICNLTTE